MNKVVLLKRHQAPAGVRLAANLSLPLDIVTETVGILAKRRAGKSYTARKLTEQLLGAGLQVIVVDPKGDWWGLRSSVDGKRPGFPSLIAGGEHGDVPLEAGGGEVLARFVVTERVSLLLDLSSFRKHEVATFMTGFLEALYRLKAREEYRTPAMLVIDEADAIGPQRAQKGEERMLGAAEDIVRRGGQRGIGCTMVTQRAAVLNKNLLTQLSVLVALRTIAPQDLVAMDDWISVHGTPAQRDVLMASLPSLPIGTAWVWSPGWPTADGIFQQVHVAPIETFDSGATPKVGQKITPPKTLADVDLGALKELLAGTIEKARQDDPRELRKHIAELERQLGARPTETRVETVTERVEIPVLATADVEKLGLLLSAARQLSADLGSAAQSISAALERFQQIAPPAPAPRAARETPLPPAPLRREQHALERRHDSAAAKGGGDKAPLPAPQQRILDALAAFEATGLADVARSNVAVFSNQSPRSSGFTNNLGALRSAGRIDYPSSGRVALTDAGRGQARPVAPIRSLRELHAAWIGQLSGPQARLLQALIACYPDTMERDELARASQQSPSSSGYTNNLGALRSLGLVDYPRPREVAATPLLFPLGLAEKPRG